MGSSGKHAGALPQSRAYGMKIWTWNEDLDLEARQGCLTHVNVALLTARAKHPAHPPVGAHYSAGYMA